MGLTLLRDFLRRHQRVAIDTSIFIYELEANPQYLALTDAIFAWLEQPGHSAVTSTITMTELLVQPYQESDQVLTNDPVFERVGAFETLLLDRLL